MRWGRFILLFAVFIPVGCGCAYRWERSRVEMLPGRNPLSQARIVETVCLSYVPEHLRPGGVPDESRSSGRPRRNY